MTPVLVWVTGLPASGKTTLGGALVDALKRQGECVLWLDSDDLRPHVVGDGGFDEVTRARFYGLITHLARRALEGGVSVVVSATAHRRAWRDAARAAVGCFVEVWQDAPPEVCAARDPKGLWRAAADGRITSLPGAGVDYEPPLAAEVRLDAGVPLGAAVDVVLEAMAWARRAI